MSEEIISESVYYVLIIGYSSICSFIVRHIAKKEFNGSVSLKSLLSLVGFSFLTPVLILIFFPFVQEVDIVEYWPIYISVVVVILITMFITVYHLDKNYFRESQKKELILNLFLAKWELREIIAEKLILTEGEYRFNQFDKNE